MYNPVEARDKNYICANGNISKTRIENVAFKILLQLRLDYQTSIK